MRMTLFLVGVLVWSVQLRVEIRDSEVWVVRDGREYQLTDDGKSKLQAELSPEQNRIAYDDHRRRAVFRFYTLLVVSDSVLLWRQFRLQLRFSVVGKLILTSITDNPNFGIADFHSKLN